MEYRHGSHSLYDLKYHVVFCTKYRYRILTGQVATRARELIREICAANYVDIVSGSLSGAVKLLYSERLAGRLSLL